MTVTDRGNDGRSDVILAEVSSRKVRALLKCSTIEDVYVEFGRTLRSEGDRPEWIASRLWKASRVDRALAQPPLSTRAARPGTTHRSVVRVLSERSFNRTRLRRAVESVAKADRPGWKKADPAILESWVVEYAEGRFVAGFRISDARMRQATGAGAPRRGGGVDRAGAREQERAGALRPAVAAAMVRLAGAGSGVLLDPCCGSGAILAAARTHGFAPVGSDIARSAIEAARHNVPDARLSLGDARAVDAADASCAAVVSNLPFGKRYDALDAGGEPLDMIRWQREVLAEAARVVRPGGAVIVLTPTLASGSIPEAVRLRGRWPIRLLGQNATIWAFERSAPSPGGRVDARLGSVP